MQNSKLIHGVFTQAPIDLLILLKLPVVKVVSINCLMIISLASRALIHLQAVFVELMFTVEEYRGGLNLLSAFFTVLFSEKGRFIF